MLAQGQHDIGELSGFGELVAEKDNTAELPDGLGSHRRVSMCGEADHARVWSSTIPNAAWPRHRGVPYGCAASLREIFRLPERRKSKTILAYN